MAGFEFSEDPLRGQRGRLSRACPKGWQPEFHPWEPPRGRAKQTALLPSVLSHPHICTAAWPNLPADEVQVAQDGRDEGTLLCQEEALDVSLKVVRGQGGDDREWLFSQNFAKHS